MSSIIENIFAISGIGFFLKIAIHLYVNYKLFDNYQPVNRGVFGTDLGLLLPIYFDNVKGNRWIIRIGNILYYFFLASLFAYFLTKLL